MERIAYEGLSAAESVHWWYTGRRSIIASELRRLDLPAGAELVEVGAGSGGNLEMLSEFGSVGACEMDAHARASANEKGLCVVHNGYLPDDLPFASSSADIVGLFDVLEHVEQDERALLTIKEVLKPGGRLLLTVPAYQWLWSHHDEYLHHFRRYSRRTLRERLEGAGLAVKRVTYFNTFLLPAAVAVRTLNLRGRDGRALGGRTPPTVVNDTLRQILGLEAALLRMFDLPAGLSLLAVAEKR